MSVFLIGYRGCGKTTVGQKLADRLWHQFVDIDELVVCRAGKSIQELFAGGEEPMFRDLESAAIEELKLVPDQVVALGGGSLQREENRKGLKEAGHKVIYLRCDSEELLRRIQSDPRSEANRPSLTAFGGNLDEIHAMLALREPIYRQTMTAELDVTNLTPDEAVVYISRMI